MNLPASVTGTTVDAANRLTAWAGTTPTYDANGNLLSQGATTYAWDERNRLTGIEQNGSPIASFHYDAFGRRITKTLNGSSTNVLYGGQQVVQELNGGPPTANLLTGLGLDEYFQRTKGGATSTYLQDALGSTIGLTNGTGAIQTMYAYDPYGNVTASGAVNDNPYQYTGRENDGTGLYYYRARYYSPVMRRFVSQDPLGFAAGQDVYAYVGGDPVNYYDQDGKARGRPYSGEPNTWYVHPLTGDMRYYGPDGNPALDIDVSHSHDGMCPHLHPWRDGERGAGESLF